MPLSAKIWSSFYCNTDTFCLALLWVLNCLDMIRWDMTTKCIMQIPNKVIPVLLVQGHEGSPHDNKFHLVDIMSDFSQLFHSIPCLEVWVVSGSDCTHWSGFITGVGLGWVLEIGVRATWTVDTNISSSCDMGTSVWFTHDGNNSNSTCSSNWFSFQQWY
jgi:hypothetical protein